MKPSVDQSLLEKLKSESNSSFELLYQRCFPAVSAYIQQNNGTSQDAEDIFQEAVIVLLRRIREPSFVLISSLNTYMYAIAKNLWLKNLRDNKSICIRNENISTLYEDLVNDNSELMLQNLQESKVENWLSKITKHCRRILKALFFDKVPMILLMPIMGWKNKHTASNQKYKCLQQLRKVSDEDA